MEITTGIKEETYTSKFKGHLNIGIEEDNLISIFKDVLKSNLEQLESGGTWGHFEFNFKFLKFGGTLENLNFGGTLVNLLGGTVGAHLGEPLGPKNRAAPLDIE